MILRLLPLLALAACTPTPSGTADAGPAPAGDGTCQAEAPKAVIGRQASAEVVQEAKRLSGARDVRQIGPDTIVTMDFRPDRLNLELDAAGKVTGVRCG